MLQRSLCPTLKPKEAYDENEHLPQDARARVKIVERHTITVKLLNSSHVVDIFRGRDGIRGQIGGGGWPNSSVVGWNIVRGAQASGITAGASAWLPEKTSVYIIGRS